MTNQNFNAIPLLQSALDKGNGFLLSAMVDEDAVAGWETSTEHAILTVFGSNLPYVKRFNKKTFHVGAFPDERQRIAWKREQLKKQVAIVAELLESARQHKALLEKNEPLQPAQSPVSLPVKSAKMPATKLHGFIASSVSGLELAHEVQSSLDHDFELVVWNQGAFTPSSYAIESLVEELNRCDFGIFIFKPEDTVQIGGGQNGPQVTVRDNVILELGLFIGRLGRKRTFIIQPRNVQNFRLPSDLFGMTPLDYEAERSDGNLEAALGKATTKIRTAVKKLGPFEQSSNNNLPDSEDLDSVRVEQASIKRVVASPTQPVESSEKNPGLALKKKKVERLIASFETMISKLDERTEVVVESFFSLDKEASNYVAKNFQEFSGYDQSFPVLDSHITRKIHKVEDIDKYKAMCDDRRAKLNEILQAF